MRFIYVLSIILVANFFTASSAEATTTCVNVSFEEVYNRAEAVAIVQPKEFRKAATVISFYKNSLPNKHIEIPSYSELSTSDTYLFFFNLDNNKKWSDFPCTGSKSLRKRPLTAEQLAMLGPPIAPNDTDTLTTFVDVPMSHPHYDAIIWAKKNIIVQGYSDGTFRPDANINRAEFLKILVDPRDAECKGSRYKYPDVNPRDWFYTYVISASCNGVVRGYDDNTFRPANNINVAEAAKIIVLQQSNGAVQQLNTTEWYTPFFWYLQENSAYLTSFNSANKFLTRGEMVEVMYRLSEDYVPEDILPTSEVIFDGCGGLDKYKNESWYQDFTNAVGTEHPYYVEELCYSDAQNVAIATTRVSECSGSDVVLFNTAKKSLATAFIDMGSLEADCLVFEEFGKRTGRIIPVMSKIYNSCAYFDYDYIANTVTYRSTQLGECLSTY